MRGHPLTSDEAGRLVEVCGGGATGARNRALVTLLYRGGLRAAEACAVELEDVKPLEGGGLEVRVRRPKGWQNRVPPRSVGLDGKSAEIIQEWLSVRNNSHGSLLFTTRTGARLQTSYLRQLLPRLARRAGIQRRVHPHALRHTFARELYDEGIGVREIQVALGHRSLDTTQTYLGSIGASRAVRVTSERKW